MAMSNHYILRHYNVYKCISKLYCYLPVVCLFQINTVVRTPPPLENSILSIQHSKQGDGSGPHPFRKFKFQNKITKGMPWTPGPGKYNYPSDPLPPKNYGSTQIPKSSSSA